MKKRKMIRRCGMFVLSVMLSLAIGCASAFADEEGVSVEVTVGEHGSVNGHTSDFTEEIDAGQSLTLEIEADSGYVIGPILVNDEELTAEDSESIQGKIKGTLDLEELEEDMTVDIEFEEDQTITEGTGDSGTTDGEDPGNAATAETGEDAGSDAEPAGADGSAEDGNVEDGSDETDDSSGDVADEGADETSADDTGATDDNKDKETQDTENQAEKGSAGTENTDHAYSSGSPKTGDDFPMSVILLMLSSMAGGAGVLGRRLWKKRLVE